MRDFSPPPPLFLTYPLSCISTPSRLYPVFRIPMSTSSTHPEDQQISELDNPPSKPAPDVHDTPLFHQLIGIIKEQNETAKAQKEIMQGMKSALERLEEKTARRLDNEKDNRGTSSSDTDAEEHPVTKPDIEVSPTELARNRMHDTLQRLSSAMESVKETLGNMKDTLLDHGKKFDILIRDAIKDDQPYDQKGLDDESTCTALFEMAMTKTKEEVDEWIKRMDVSLVFNLFPSSNNTPGNPTDAPPPLPKVSAENVCVSYYLALILAILDAVLSVLGRQWMSKLTNRPEGGTYRERLLRHIERERLAKRWLRYLVEGLHVILLCSIGLFVSGLLYQLWNLSGSFEDRAPRLLATWVLGLLLSLSILGVVLGATFHALIYEASPFGGPFSRLIFLAAKRMAASFEPWMERVAEAARRLDSRYKTRRKPFRRILPSVGRVIGGPLWMSSKLVDAWRVQLNLNDRDRLLTTYMDLIAEASDPKLLERAVASFSYVDWFQNRDQSQEELARMKKTWDRLTATDTSLRVRETLTARARQFVPSDRWEIKVLGERLTTELMQFFCAIHSYPQYFRDSLVADAFKPDNADLRPLAALPFEECVARVLCSYNHKGKLGHREEIFDLAENHCTNLLWEGKRDDVTRILSHVDRLDLINSFIQYPHYIYSSLVEFIVKDCKHELLRETNQFVKTCDPSRLGRWSLSRIFVVLASPPPTDLDLCPHIDYLSQHPHPCTWNETNDTIIGYLNSFPLSQFSDPTTGRRFLQRCVDYEFQEEDGVRYFTSYDTRVRAHKLLAELDSISPPTAAIASTSNQPASPSHSPSNARLLSNASQPDHLLSPTIEFPSAAPEDIHYDPATFIDSDAGIPMTILNHAPDPVSDPSLASNLHAAFDQSSALENAHKED
ncbi:hypothetical protein SISNIDRAFT_528187 [Sistotremastrum niveocremeum HHB9708]|uniref:DUF6535 domain-containing protein n=1 Tax=Sistotremastrum niveocremeum HHB9708 TaxID=1314777 RepID=A0A164PR52_9AGAM|nr:hypothetical protein SISNIDRAFT_528187 [Sistotremastrum niveocremeum HHB9708]